MKNLLLVSTFLVLFYSCNQKPDTTTSKSDSNDLEDLISLAQASPYKKIVYDKLNFGNGYNSATGREYFGVLDYQGALNSTEVSANAIGNSGTIKMELLESKESLKEILDISASVELDVKLYGVSSDNTVKGSIYNETEFSNFTQHAIIKAQYTNEPLMLINPQVKSDLIELANENPEEFMRTCGDMFVSRIYTGGNMFALFSLHGRDSYERSKNELFFKSVNTYMSNKLTVEGEVKKIKDQMNSVKNISVEIFTEGGGKTPAKTTIEDLMDYAGAFKEQVGNDNRSIILYAELMPYEAIAGFPKLDFSKIRVDQRMFLDQSLKLFDMVEKSYENAEFTLANQSFFADANVVVADSVITKMPHYKAELRSKIAACTSDFNDCNPKDLNEFIDFETFEPEIDYPSFEGTEVELPIKFNNYKTVFENTNDGVILSIEGKLESREAKNRANVSCKNVNFTKKKRMLLNSKRGYNYKVQIWEEYFTPYYVIRYLDQNGQFLREFNWQGTPIKTEKNVQVAMKLVNPLTKFYFKSQGRYHFLSFNQTKNLQQDQDPEYTAIRECPSGGPKVVISPLNPVVKKNTLMTSNSTPPKTFPKVVVKENFLGYEYN